MGSAGASSQADPEAVALVVEVDGRRVRLDREFLAGTTRDGDPTLLHGYAITGHVAQGLTVDHSLVLASGGIGNEWAYVALSRGRESNRLYVAEREDDARAEFAPVDRAGVGALERLRRSLESSQAQVLAIDSGTPRPRVRARTSSPPRRGSVARSRSAAALGYLGAAGGWRRRGYARRRPRE